MSRSIPLPFSPARTARPTRRAALAAGLLLSLTACTGPGDDEAGTTAPPQDEPVGDGLTLADPWVKAAEESVSEAGQVFVSFQADLNGQFLPIQRRLDALDLLNQWTTPIGSAVFAIPPGCAEGDYVGRSVLE